MASPFGIASGVTREDLSYLLSLIPKKFKLNREQETGHRFADSGVLHPLIAGSIASSSVISAEDHQRYVTTSMNLALRSVDYTVETFLENCRKQYNADKKIVGQRFLLWTRLRAGVDDRKFKKYFQIDQCRVTVTASLPRDFAKEPTFNQEYLSSLDEVEGGGFIYAEGEFRDEEAAGDPLSDCIEITLATMNFLLVQKTYRSYRTSLVPRASLLTGPNFYLYDRTLRKYTTSVYMADDFHRKFWGSTPLKISHITQELADCNLIHKRMESSKLYRVVRRALLMLNRSLSAQTTESRAMRLWMAFETAFTRRGEQPAWKVIARRASSFDQEPELAKAKLRYVSSIRNSSVHPYADGVPDVHAERILEDLTHLLCHIISFLIKNRKLFTDHQMVLDVVDQDRGKDSIDRQLRTVQIAKELFS